MSRLDVIGYGLVWVNGAFVGAILAALWIHKQLTSGNRVVRGMGEKP